MRKIKSENEIGKREKVRERKRTVCDDDWIPTAAAATPTVVIGSDEDESTTGERRECLI
jgi:hypothetical protein